MTELNYMGWSGVVRNCEEILNILRQGNWRRVVHDCEEILGCPDRSETATMANLPNLVRHLKVEKIRLLEALEKIDARVQESSGPGAEYIRAITSEVLKEA